MEEDSQLLCCDESLEALHHWSMHNGCVQVVPVVSRQDEGVFHLVSLVAPLHRREIQDARLLYYLIREIKTWLNINHITVHRNMYCIF